MDRDPWPPAPLVVPRGLHLVVEEVFHLSRGGVVAVGPCSLGADFLEGQVEVVRRGAVIRSGRAFRELPHPPSPNKVAVWLPEADDVLPGDEIRAL